MAQWKQYHISRTAIWRQRHLSRPSCRGLWEREVWPYGRCGLEGCCGLEGEVWTLRRPPRRAVASNAAAASNAANGSGGRRKGRVQSSRLTCRHVAVARRRVGQGARLRVQEERKDFFWRTAASSLTAPRLPFSLNFMKRLVSTGQLGQHNSKNDLLRRRLALECRQLVQANCRHHGMPHLPCPTSSAALSDS